MLFNYVIDQSNVSFSFSSTSDRNATKSPQYLKKKKSILFVVKDYKMNA